MIAPHLEEMDKTMDDVVFLKVDVDECEDIAEEYKVMYHYAIIPISSEGWNEVKKIFLVECLFSFHFR